MDREPIYNLNSITIQGMIKRGQIPDPSIPGNEDLFYYGNKPTISKCDQYGNTVPGTTRRLEDDAPMPDNMTNPMYSDVHGRDVFTQQGTGLRYPAPQFPIQGNLGYNGQNEQAQMQQHQITQQQQLMIQQQMMYQQQAMMMQQQQMYQQQQMGGYQQPMQGYPQQMNQPQMYNPNMMGYYQQPNYGYIPQQQVPQGYGFGYPTNIPQGNVNFEYNPFMAGSQYSIYETQMREKKREESAIWKLCAKASTHYAGIDISDEEIDRMFDPDREMKEYQKRMELLEKNDISKKIKVVLKYGDEIYVSPDYKEIVDKEKAAHNGVSATEQKAKMRREHPEMFGVIDSNAMIWNINRLVATCIPCNMNIAMANARHNYLYDKQKEKYPDSMTLYEFLDRSHEMIIDMKEREFLNKFGGKLNMLYDSDQFRKTLLDPRGAVFDPNAPCRYPTDPHSGFGLSFLAENGRGFQSNKEYSDYTGISYNPTLGCMEVTVPERIRKNHTTFDEARSNFMTSIINQRR